MFCLNYRGMEFTRYVRLDGTTVRYVWNTAEYDYTGYDEGEGVTLFECFNQIDELLEPTRIARLENSTLKAAQKL